MAIVGTRTMVIVVVETITAIAAVVAAFISWKNHDKISEVKVSVNGRLDSALTEIAELKKAVSFEKTQPAEGTE